MRRPAVNVDAPRRAVTVDGVRTLRAQIEQLGAQYGVQNVRVFGSVVRGEVAAASDADLLVDAVLFRCRCARWYDRQLIFASAEANRFW